MYFLFDRNEKKQKKADFVTLPSAMTIALGKVRKTGNLEHGFVECNGQSTRQTIFKKIKFFAVCPGSCTLTKQYLTKKIKNFVVCQIISTLGKQ
jgi:hypothetical protein